MAFEHIVFDEDWKAKRLERTQLHRLLAHELWIFGEEFDLATDDEGLKAVLKKHLEIMGRSDFAPTITPDEVVKTIENKDCIPDLMLYHRGKVDRATFEHLVIELKRPRDPLGSTELFADKKICVHCRKG